MPQLGHAFILRMLLKFSQHGLVMFSGETEFSFFFRELTPRQFFRLI